MTNSQRRPSMNSVLSGTLALVLAVGLAPNCSSTTGGSSAGQSGRVGDLCTPEQEKLTSFLGFGVNEVNIESMSPACQSRICLVNHFQGRVSCPYGQLPDGTPRTGAVPCNGTFGCCTPGTNQGVNGLDANGNPIDPTAKATVEPQYLDRSEDRTVYCSCRCANASGNTNDGATYCSCPTGFTCTQLVAPISVADQGISGAYCIKGGTQYDPNANACAATCDPVLRNCGTKQLQ